MIKQISPSFLYPPFFDLIQKKSISSLIIYFSIKKFLFSILLLFFQQYFPFNFQCSNPTLRMVFKQKDQFFQVSWPLDLKALSSDLNIYIVIILLSLEILSLILSSNLVFFSHIHLLFHQSFVHIAFTMIWYFPHISR